MLYPHTHCIRLCKTTEIFVKTKTEKTAVGKTKNLVTEKNYWITKIYNVLLLTAAYSCKIQGVFNHAKMFLILSCGKQQNVVNFRTLGKFYFY